MSDKNARDDGLVDVVIAKQCVFRHDDGTADTLRPGPHRLPQKMADHWFVQAHTDNPPPATLTPGTPQFANAERARVARQKLLAEAAAQMAEEDRQKGVQRGVVNTAAENAKDSKIGPVKR